MFQTTWRVLCVIFVTSLNYDCRWLQEPSQATPPSAGATNRTTPSCSQMALSDPLVMWVFVSHWRSLKFKTSKHSFWRNKTIVLQHAPYDAMVLVTMCWYLDQEIKATEGKWKVSARFSLYISWNSFCFSCPFTHLCHCFLGLWRSQTDGPPWGAAVHCGQKSLQWHQTGQTAVSGVGEPSKNRLKSDLCLVAAVRVLTLSLVIQTQDLQIVCYAFKAFGKTAIKQKKLHPDSFVQLAMQLAYYRLHKKYVASAYNLIFFKANEGDDSKMYHIASLRPGSCYETAMTRKFYHGRTETMRPCTQEAVNWCKAMMDPACDVNVLHVSLW